MGEKEPYDDPSETHGKCPECLARQRKKKHRTHGNNLIDPNKIKAGDVVLVSVKGLDPLSLPIRIQRAKSFFDCMSTVRCPASEGRRDISNSTPRGSSLGRFVKLRCRALTYGGRLTNRHGSVAL